MYLAVSQRSAAKQVLFLLKFLAVFVLLFLFQRFPYRKCIAITHVSFQAPARLHKQVPGSVMASASRMTLQEALRARELQH